MTHFSSLGRKTSFALSFELFFDAAFIDFLGHEILKDYPAVNDTIGLRNVWNFISFYPNELFSKARCSLRGISTDDVSRFYALLAIATQETE